MTRKTGHEPQNSRSLIWLGCLGSQQSTGYPKTEFFFMWSRFSQPILLHNIKGTYHTEPVLVLTCFQPKLLWLETKNNSNFFLDIMTTKLNISSTIQVPVGNSNPQFCITLPILAQAQCQLVLYYLLLGLKTKRLSVCICLEKQEEKESINSTNSTPNRVRMGPKSF